MSSGGHNKIKASVESTRRIDIRHLQKIGLFNIKAGTMAEYNYDWKCRGESRGNVLVRYKKDSGDFNIIYTITHNDTGKKEDVNQSIELDYVETNYGERGYFICPTCYERRTTLCFNGKFKCRVCAGLNYYSSQMNHDRYTKPDKKIETILKKLKYKTDNICDVYYVPKPKRMRYETYQRLLEELRQWKYVRNMVISQILNDWKIKLNNRARKNIIKN